jgi:diguanylate cyclase (GGDEF)-like protein
VAAAPAPAAPEGRLSFRSFGLDEGLGNLAVWSLLQDARGFLWAGTEDGLYRFDGSRFQGFGPKEGLPSHYVWELHEDPAGVLWVGTIKGLARRDGERFVAVPLEGADPAPEITDIASGPQGRLWLGTALGPYSGTGAGALQAVPGWPGGAVTALWAAPGSDRVLAAAWNQSRARILAWEGGRWKEFVVPAALGALKLDSLAVDGRGRIWARSVKGLWFLDPGDPGFRPVLPAVAPAQQRGQLFIDPEGHAWTTTGQGLVQFLETGQRQLSGRDGLPHVSLTAMTQDHEGSLWVAGAGIYRLMGGGAWRAHAQEQGLPPGPIWSIFRDRDGQRYAGTDRGLVRAEGGAWRPVPGTSALQVRTLVQAADGALFMAGSPEILRWDPRHGGVTRFAAGDGIVTGGRIYRLLFGPDGRLWVGTDKGGLLAGSLIGGRWRFTRAEIPKGGAQETFRDLCLDAAGRLWAAGDQGLAILDGGRWHRFTKADGLRDDNVTFLSPARDGAVRFTYFEPEGIGVARFHSGAFQVVRHLDDSFPPATVVYIMGDDARGAFWVGTGQGIDRLVPGRQVEHFGRADGLVGEDTSAMAFLAEPGGDVWFGTAFGLARFDASRDPGPPKPPVTVILSCKLGGAAQPVQEGAQLKVPSRANTFEATFSGLSFRKEGAVQYETRMLGLEAEWHETGTREVRYPALAPGVYRFEVRARIGRGAWGQAAALGLEVLPNWYQSVWFRTLAGFGGVGVAGLLVWGWVAALHRRNQLLKAMVDERTRELELANQQLRNQSLTDPLTGLRNRRYLGVCMPEDVAQVSRVHHTTSNLGPERVVQNIDMIFIMVDLDHFKDVNDHYGHAAGDRVLQEVARLLRLATRDADTIVRWGGEEFLVVARNAARADATVLMERIRTQINSHPFRLDDGREIRCSCSLGFTFFPLLHQEPDLLSWERLVDVADRCLYAAKRGGRNAWVGLYPGPEPDLDRLVARIPGGIGELVWTGQLEVRSSLAPDVLLEWDGSA